MSPLHRSPLEEGDVEGHCVTGDRTYFRISRQEGPRYSGLLVSLETTAHYPFSGVTACIPWEKLEELGLVRVGSNDSCPVCGNDNIEGDSVDIGNEEASQECGCVDCGAEWVEVYAFTHHADIKGGKQ